jgi:BlaI family transcriptional regulator, penicillinase repressor
MTHTTPVPKLGKVQLQIMQVLWRERISTARQITDELSKSSPIARSTVQTLLRQMEAKRLIEHSVDEAGVFQFRPLVPQSDIAETAAGDLLDRMFQGSLYELVAHLLKPEKFSAEELRRLRDLIDETRRDDGRPSEKSVETSR